MRRSLDKSVDQGMGMLGGGDHLGHKKCGDKKWMGCQLQQAHLPIRAKTSRLEIFPKNLRPIRRVEPEITGELFLCLGSAIRPASDRAWNQIDGLGCPHQRTDQFADDQARRVRSRLGMFSIGDIEDIAGILYQSMLKPPSGSNKRLALFPRKADAIQRALHAVIRAAR